jgi:hypothetical protein
MNIKSASKIALIVALSLGATVAVADKRATFISPLELQLIPANDPYRPQVCQKLNCPTILGYGGRSGVRTPVIDPAFKADLPNVRVSFFVQQISHDVIAGGGIDAGSAILTWYTDGSAASDQAGGPYNILLIAAGETWVADILIYDALVLGACNTFSSFPVTHTATVTMNGVEIGSFEGADNSTIDSTGFYNLSYTIEAADGAGGVSQFHVSGKVTATCSAAGSL